MLKINCFDEDVVVPGNEQAQGCSIFIGVNYQKIRSVCKVNIPKRSITFYIEDVNGNAIYNGKITRVYAVTVKVAQLRLIKDDKILLEWD